MKPVAIKFGGLGSGQIPTLSITFELTPPATPVESMHLAALEKLLGDALCPKPAETRVVVFSDAFADASPANQKATAEQIVARALAPKDPT